MCEPPSSCQSEFLAKRLPAVHHRYGIKPDPLTAKAICDGVVAGMLGDHFLGRSEAAFESAIRPYVLAVALKRGFGAFLEFPLEKQTDVSGRESIAPDSCPELKIH